MPRRRSSPVRPFWKRAVPSVLILLGAALFIAILFFLHHSALDVLRGHERFRLPFAELECLPPPPMLAEDFLAEVQYLAGLPDQLDLLDQGLAERLYAAFQLHPRVEQVDRVEVLKERRIVVHLRYAGSHHP